MHQPTEKPLKEEGMSDAGRDRRAKTGKVEEAEEREGADPLLSLPMEDENLSA